MLGWRKVHRFWIVSENYGVFNYLDAWNVRQILLFLWLLWILLGSVGSVLLKWPSASEEALLGLRLDIGGNLMLLTIL
jgi:hypothetical protein